MKPFIEITNADLTESGLPLFTNKWDRPLMQFAMSFDGYRFMESPTTQQLGAFANQAMRTYEKEKSLPKSLSELRACLFFEGRRWHHVGSAVGGYEAFDKDGRAMKYIHALLEAIARKIRDGERE
jgi:hypothetical protein